MNTLTILIQFQVELQYYQYQEHDHWLGNITTPVLHDSSNTEVSLFPD
jgi:hypothetical protein